MATKILPDATLLRQLFSYDPETGALVHKARPRSMFKSGAAHKAWNTCHAGRAVPSRPKSRYTTVQIFGKIYYTHRIVYKLFHGDEPPPVLDHANGNGQDNRISNIRSATQSQNMMNKTHQSNSKTRLKGVSFRKDTKKYTARIRACGKYLSLGNFPDPESAYVAYLDAAKRFHGRFAKP